MINKVGKTLKQFKFSLEKVLKYKFILEDQRKIEFATAQKEYAKEKALLDKLNNEFRQKQKEFYSGRLEAAILFQRSTSLQFLRDQITKQNKNCEKASIKVNKCWENMVEAKQDREILEKLKQRRKAEYEKFANFKEQKQIDEIATSAYARN